MKKKKTKAVLSIVFLITLSAVIAAVQGCSREETEEPVEITLMHGWGGTPQTHKTMSEIYAGFSAENPDIKLNCIPYASSEVVVEQGNDMLAVGKMPNIIGTSGLSYYVKNAVKTGKAMDILPYIETDPEWKASIAPAVFDTWVTGNNRMYTLPDVLEVAGYWFNSDYFIQAGITNENGNAKIPSTWGEFMETAAKLQEWIDATGQNISVFALEDAQTVEFLFLARLAGEGENGLDACRNSYVRIKSETLENVLSDMEQIGNLARWVDNIENARQCFADGDSIIYFNGVWESDVLKDSEHMDVLTYANYPTESGQSLAYISPSSGYVLSNQTNERTAEAEIRFLKYMLSDEVQTKIAVETGQAPANPNIDMDRVIQESPMFGSAIDEAYGAQIQIKTIFSVWTQEDINTVQKYLSRDSWNPGAVIEMLRELNADIG